MNVIITVEVPDVGRDAQGAGRRRVISADYYREEALKLLQEDPVWYVDNAYVEGE